MAQSLFATVRRVTYVILFALAAVELGLAANLTNLFLSVHRDFLIFALVPPSFTILIILGLLAKSRPGIDLILILITDILWLALGAYSVDVIGYTQCDTLAGQTIQTSIGGAYSSQSYCYQVKTIEAVAWAEFGLFLICFWVVLAITLMAAGRGEPVWQMDVDELQWFSTPQYGGGAYQYGQYGQQQQYPQYYANGSASGGGGQAHMMAQGQYYGQPVVVAQPGRNIVVSQTANGPQVQEIPTGAGLGAGTSSSRTRRTSDVRR